ncbi:UNVERIFIED_CONTAM: hypothetical protein FKN15_051155 [Acipenser sinensis]
MFKLEHGSQDRGKLQPALPSLSHIQEKQEAWRDDFLLKEVQAYEDRQRLKRREISARSWFPSPVADRASDTLKRLGLTLGSTSAPSLGSPSCSTALPVSKGLGIVLRRSSGSDIAAAQEPEASLGVRESDTPRGNDNTDAPTPACAVISVISSQNERNRFT